ncbi:MAG: hypothetical protein GY928_20695 [Colwellia sp.]|nr:hypothetical protein [Colwellia sp.]
MSKYDIRDIKDLMEICTSVKTVKTSQQLKEIFMQKLEHVEKIRNAMAEFDKRQQLEDNKNV